MRNEQEMFDLILKFAEENNTIRAVLLNGSRANPNAKKDIFMDYDIIYMVDNTKTFIENKNWISYFGEILIMQEPDNQKLFSIEIPNEYKYTYLMQFTDGNRIDLTFAIIDFVKKVCKADSQTVILMDKENLLSKIPHPSDKSYFIKKPTENEFIACCNEFWWISTYLAKGLWRKNLIYSLGVYYQNIHIEFMNLLRWYIGIKNNFKISSGKYDKYFEKLLPSEIYNKFLNTYPSANDINIWKAFKIMCELFDDIAIKISNNLNFKYNNEESKNVMNYIFGEEK